LVCLISEEKPPASLAGQLSVQSGVGGEVFLKLVRNNFILGNDRDLLPHLLTNEIFNVGVMGAAEYERVDAPQRFQIFPEY